MVDESEGERDQKEEEEGGGAPSPRAKGRRRHPSKPSRQNRVVCFHRKGRGGQQQVALNPSTLNTDP